MSIYEDWCNEIEEIERECDEEMRAYWDLGEDN